MDNNGANKETLPVETNAHKYNRLYWTSNGIFWLDKSDVIHRYDTETKVHTQLLNLSVLGPMCKANDQLGCHVSRDGRRFWVETSHAPTDGNKDTIKCREYDRGGRAYLHFSPDYKSYSVGWRTQWGHGDIMGRGGEVFLAQLGGHRLLYVTRQYRDSIGTLYNEWELEPPYSGEAREYGQCINNDSIIVAKLNYWNWHTKQLLGTFSAPGGVELARVWFSMWDGALPDPSAVKPVLLLNSIDLIFYKGDAPQELVAKNTAGGTLPKVTVSVTPQSDWLTVKESQGEGNSQKLLVTVDYNKISASKSAKLTVSAAGVKAQECMVYFYNKGTPSAVGSGAVTKQSVKPALSFASGKLFFNSHDEIIRKVTVSRLDGKVLIAQSGTDLSQLTPVPSGVYLYTITTGHSQSFTGSFLVY